jgi:hypothetical protein
MSRITARRPGDPASGTDLTYWLSAMKGTANQMPVCHRTDHAFLKAFSE